jgi:hypothetical protein
VDTSEGDGGGRFDWLMLVVLVIDAMALALVELFFLPLRFDGRLLPDWGSWPFPITAVVALVTMPLLITRAAKVSGRIMVAGAPLWAWLLTIGIVGMVGVENEVLLNDWRTLLLLACGALPAAMALGNSLGQRARPGQRDRGGRRSPAAPNPTPTQPARPRTNSTPRR